MAEGGFDMIPGLAPAMPPASGGSGGGSAVGSPAAAGSADHLSFSDILSQINPLQHLPVVGTIYRAITGDTLSAPFRIAGSFVAGLVTGGPIGAIAGIGGAIVEEMFFSRPSQPDVKPAAAASRAPATSPPAAQARTPPAVVAATSPAPTNQLVAGQTVTLAPPTETSTAAALAAYRNVQSYALG
ncbi:MAG TPA: hypothetical protein VHS58_14670 [Acetobacteraceae bacterium]|jgi:hypothetical protein|nr:hypothetical protein [Acetobacteraceae bacterium]